MEEIIGLLEKALTATKSVFHILKKIEKRLNIKSGDIENTSF